MRARVLQLEKEPLLTTAREKPTQQKDLVQAKNKTDPITLSNTYIHFFSSLNKMSLSACLTLQRFSHQARAGGPSIRREKFRKCSSRSWSLATLAILKSLQLHKKERSLHFLIQATPVSVTREVEYLDYACLLKLGLLPLLSWFVVVYY